VQECSGLRLHSIDLPKEQKQVRSTREIHREVREEDA
jgi:hypothetical protein